ncbi:MAG: 5'/3'-nucleotidase SurE [Pirellulaceae bacterium]|nr:5'/3'-nucleotidase SurE [Pirellulaceae bacterium]
MRILITNDDGIDAPGLQALWKTVHHALADRSPQVVVVAPDRCRSECGHSVTAARPLRLREVSPGWYSLDGTPVDCVRVALTTVMPGPTLTLSGINAGANLGVNLMVSGTFAAAREAAVHQIPAMAVSHYRRPDVPRTWDHTPQWVEATLREFVAKIDADPTSHPLWNVNLPAIDPTGKTPSVRWCDVDRCPITRTATQDAEHVSFDLDFHGRPRKEGTDVDCCFSGYLTISEVSPHVS